MADPKQISKNIPPYLQRVLPNWATPTWTEAKSWRNIVRNQPIAVLAKEKLIAYVQGNAWTIKAKDTNEESALKDEIAYYREWVFRNFDEMLSLLWQDALDLPVGGNLEVVRFPPNATPTVTEYGQTWKTVRPNPLGHPFKLVHIDGATVFPTYDEQFPIGQKLETSIAQPPVYFEGHQHARIVLSPRPEIGMRGYGMPPPQRIFLSIALLHQGDQYYKNLLSDVPEAGILDLIDMSESDATDWLEGYKSLLYGLDPQKIGVLYQHTQAAKYIPFNRPPSEMMFDSVTAKYARIAVAGYWLRLSDLGLEDGPATLAGTIREQEEAKLTGYGVVKEKTKNLINSKILPPYLEFSWIEKDNETATAKGRARLLNAQAMNTFKQAGFITGAEGQQQLVKDGLFSIELAAPPENEPPMNSPVQPQNGGPEVEKEKKRVPPPQGGRGDVGVQKSLTDTRPDMAAVPTDSPHFDRLTGILQDALRPVNNPTDLELTRLIKAATRAVFPISEKAIHYFKPNDLEQWQTERVNLWLDLDSELANMPDVQKADNKILDMLDKLLDKSGWWKILESIAGRISQVFTGAFSEGAIEAAREIREFLYTEDLLTSPDLLLDFNLKNLQTLKMIDRQAAQLVTRVNDGTKYYIKRILLAQVDKGLSSPAIAQMIKSGAGVEDILKDARFTKSVMNDTRAAVGKMSDYRVNSIVNTEINRAEGLGRLEQWEKQGLTRKRWVHPPHGPDMPCHICSANIEKGFVALDYMFDDVFTGTLVPPGHPGVCHCRIEFDTDEVVKKAGKLNTWNGS
jgi:hypothetical protein